MTFSLEILVVGNPQNPGNSYFEYREECNKEIVDMDDLSACTARSVLK
jgi:hypothetical protein